MPITDEGIFEAQRALASEEGLYAEPSALVGLTAVMQQARAGDLRPDQRIVVVLTSGGLKDYGASRAWLPEVPAAGRDFASTLAVLEEQLWPSAPALASARCCWARARPATSVERARAAERAGLDSLWFIEDYFQTGAFAVAGAAAAVTSRHRDRLGRGQSLTRGTRRCSRWRPRRWPASRRDAWCSGLGAGVRRWIEEQMAIPAPRPLAALAECVDVVRRLWAGERVTHEGTAFSLERLALEFKPAQAALPIVLGVKGPRALALAGTVADGVRVLDHVVARPRPPRVRHRGRGAARGRPRGAVPGARLRADRDRA